MSFYSVERIVCSKRLVIPTSFLVYCHVTSYCLVSLFLCFLIVDFILFSEFVYNVFNVIIYATEKKASLISVKYVISNKVFSNQNIFLHDKKNLNVTKHCDDKYNSYVKSEDTNV